MNGTESRKKLRERIERQDAEIEQLRKENMEWRTSHSALAIEAKTLRDALEAVDSEIVLDGQLKELVDAALHASGRERLRDDRWKHGAESMRETILQLLPGGQLCDPQQIADMIRAIALPGALEQNGQKP